MRSRPSRSFSRPFIALLALALAVPAVFAQVDDYRDLKYPPLRPFTVPQPERVVLDNGMVVLLLEDHELPLIEARARIRVGSSLEPADKVGLTSIFGGVLRTGGTRSMTGDAIDDFLEARAASIETGVTDTFGWANLSCLKADFPDVLKVYSDILRHPVFDESKIKILKNQINSQISRRNDDPQQIMNREFDKLVYGADSPYARTSEYATIANVSRDDLLAFHDRYIHPDRIILGVVGDFDSARMKSVLASTFGGWAKGPPMKEPVIEMSKGPKPGIYYVRKEDMTQSDIIMGHLGILESNPDLYAVDVLNEAFGGGFAARLFSNVRSKKGLAYSVRGSVGSHFGYPGTFNVWMTTKTGTTAAGIDALLEEIDAIVSRPPDSDEVKRAKSSILNSFIFNFDSRAKILNQQLTYEYFGFPRDYLAHYRENIEKVTPEDVARVARKYIHKDAMAILVVGPSQGIDRPLDSFGKVALVDIAIPEPEGPSAPAASADSLAEGKRIFARVVEGLGGAKAVDAVKGVRTTSDTTVQTQQGEMTVKVVSTVSLPDRVRQELQTPMGQVLRVVSGDEGFMVTPMGTVGMPPTQREQITRSTRRQPLVLAQHRDDPELTAQALGQESVDGREADVILVTWGDEQVRLWVDRENGRILRQMYQGQGPGGPGEIVTTFGDFREVSGVTLPFRTAATFNGDPLQSSTAHEVVINPEVDATLFARPSEGPSAADKGGR